MVQLLRDPRSCYLLSKRNRNHALASLPHDRCGDCCCGVGIDRRAAAITSGLARRASRRSPLGNLKPAHAPDLLSAGGNDRRRARINHRDQPSPSIIIPAERSLLQAGEPSRQRNKRTVLAFHDAALNRKNIDEAAAYFGLNFIQHNPRSKDGIEGFRSLLQDVRKQFPRLRSDVKRVFADGDCVILHVHVKLQPEELGLAIVEIFRLEHGKIIEHWDVRRPIPEAAANTNGMF